MPNVNSWTQKQTGNSEGYKLFVVAGVECVRRVGWWSWVAASHGTGDRSKGVVHTQKDF